MTVDLGPAENLVAEYGGPLESVTARTTPSTRNSQKISMKPGEYLWRGQVPKATQPGTYRLEKLTIFNTAGPRNERDYPPEDLPEDAFLIVEPGPPVPRSLPTITKIE